MANIVVSSGIHEFMQAADYAAARTVLGLGDSATKNVGTAETDVASGNHTHAQLHDAATVNGNGISIVGQQISLDIGTGATQVASGNHTHAQLHNAATVSGNGISIVGQQISLDIGTGATQVASGNHGHAQLHDAATVAGNGISINGQEISLSIGTGANQVASGNHGHAQLHDAATVAGNGISINGQEISLSIGTGANQVASGNHLHDGTYLPIPSIITETGTTRTLALTDAYDWIHCTHVSGCTITVPPQTSVAWENGTVIYGDQGAAGAVTIATGSGVTINCADTLVTDGQHSVFALTRIQQNVWILMGKLIP